MGKITLWCLLTVGILAQTGSLENNCLSCHKTQQIPNHLIYRRYLLKYSSHQQIENAMFIYLKNPHKSTSIMPPQFFLKFPMKEALNLEDKELDKHIKAFIKEFDVRKKLILKKKFTLRPY